MGDRFAEDYKFPCIVLYTFDSDVLWAARHIIERELHRFRDAASAAVHGFDQLRNGIGGQLTTGAYHQTQLQR